MKNKNIAREKTLSPVADSPRLPGGVPTSRRRGDFTFSQSSADDFRDLLQTLTAQIKRSWDCNNPQCAPEVMR